MIETDKNAMVHQPPLPRQFGSDFLVLESGKGVYLTDVKGKIYLDFGSGIAVNALGHGRDDLAEVAARQMRKIIHSSNLYTTEPTIELAAKLIASGPFAAAHFGNSGTEANEAAIKYARAYAKRVKGEGRHKLLCFSNAFHGRTLGALSVTPNNAYREPFEPLLPGVEICPFNDTGVLEKMLDPSFAGVIGEVVQGEGGLKEMTPPFAAALNRLCRLHDIILIADEVQTGLGRTGALFASAAVGLEPDIITLAKPLAGGLPLSATLIPAKINDILKPGDHGSTFGGGPVTTAVASYLWDTISRPDFLSEVRAKGDHLAARLSVIAGKFKDGPFSIGETRGMGLLRGLEVIVAEEKTADTMKQIIAAGQDFGILLLRSGKNVIRIAPPLIISREEIDKGTDILERVLSGIKEKFS
jgi:acetylornithine/N-succinyldiaminopimelate aminotransferase